MSRQSLLPVILVLVGMVSLTGCPPKKKLAIEEKPLAEEPMPEETPMDENALLPGEVRITQEWSEIPALEAVRFAYDSSSLDTAGRNVLKSNVAVLKKLPTSVTIRVEGHCDDRGTIEYNIALGQRRANAVRSYYATAGIAGNRLETISYGEERLLCTEQTDACWQQNRRAVTKVRNKETIKINTNAAQ